MKLIDKIRNKWLIEIIALLLIIPFANGIDAQTLPSDRLYHWEDAGIPENSFISFDTIYLSDYGIFPDSTSDRSWQLNELIKELDDQKVILCFDPGIYLFNHTISLKSNIILHGAGSKSTVLIFEDLISNQNCIEIAGKIESEDSYSPLQSSLKGSNEIVLPDGHDLEEGDFFEISIENGIWDQAKASWGSRAVGQICRITNIEGNTIRFEPELRIDFHQEQTPVITKLEPIQNTGIEQLKIIYQGASSSETGYNILIQYAENCFIRAVESDFSRGSHFMINNSSHIEVSGCYLHDAFDFSGKSTKGYGVCLNHYSGDCLVSNNVFEKLRHAMIVKTGANGNVISYNYSVKPIRTEFPTDFSGDISLHGYYAYANLFEGNIVQNIIIDHYWGPSGPGNTFFRNRALGYGIIMTSSTYPTHNQNFICNEIINKSFLHGNFILTGSNHFLINNYVNGDYIPQKTEPLLLSSLYLDKPPSFWDNSIKFPPIGNTGEEGNVQIPAKSRYILHEILTYPNPDKKSRVNTSINIQDNGIIKFVILEENSIQLLSKSDIELSDIRVFDIQGRMIVTKGKNKIIKGYNTIELGRKIPEGHFFILIESKNSRSLFSVLR